ncbi:glutamyl-tRNA reductase [Silvanigrella aquatica]|uniref:Glutamyl-tRNA reductase n=1 Tax=Silvanigrella aquatica TaxID=1915309 RepID=A0A1L4D1F2_9BACT|nr:glutamyl-tRNA reductase [Silvanigrella aquatica]APJ04033.1 glutamyl-tRNA reductase [Silvanigrella aquatica]
MTSSTPFFSYCGVHYKTCPVELREAWAAVGTSENLNTILKKLIPDNVIEFVIISTCNRFDICFFGKLDAQKIYFIYYELFQLSLQNNKELIQIKLDKITSYVKINFDAHALRHLFKVTASLDSLVLGEPQILGQIKDAYVKAVEFGSAQSLAGPVFNRCFRVAKKIRTQTDIGKNGISIGHAAIDVISRVFESFEGKKIVIIGAGEMSRITAQHLIFSKARSIFIANRTFARAEKLALDLGDAWPLELDDALNRIYEFDICITAASGNHYIIQKSDLKDYQKKRQGKLAVMVDISVPRKIDPAISDWDNLFLFNVDDLDSVMEKNREMRKHASLLAENIIEEEVQDYIFTCKQKENLANVGRLHSWVKNVVDYEVSRYMRDINNGKKIEPQVISDAVAKKIVSYAASLAKNNMKIENDENTVGDLLEFLFNLSEQPLLPENIQKEDNLFKLPMKNNKMNLS